MTTDKYKLGAKETVYCYTEEERELARKKAHQLGLTQWNGVVWTADKEHRDIYYAFLEGKFILGRHYPYYQKNEGYTSVHVREWLKRFSDGEVEMDIKINNEVVYCKTKEETVMVREKAHSLGLKWHDGDSYLECIRPFEDIYHNLIRGVYVVGDKDFYEQLGYQIITAQEWLARFSEFGRGQRVQFGNDICIFTMDLGDGTCVLVRNGVKIFALLQDVKPVQVFDERLKLYEDEAIYCSNNGVYAAMVRDHLDTLGYRWSSGETHRNLFYETPIKLIPRKDGTHYDDDHKNCVTARAWLARHKIFVAGTTLKLEDGKMGNCIRKEGNWVWVSVVRDNECTKIEKYHQDAVELGDK
jgi:hypothetical protein